MGRRGQPKTAILMGQYGGLGVLNLQGLWTRYEMPMNNWPKSLSVSKEEYVPLMQKLYEER